MMALPGHCVVIVAVAPAVVVVAFIDGLVPGVFFVGFLVLSGLSANACGGAFSNRRR
jgi:hypothetical protein